MPNVFLEPIEHEDGSSTDPAADIAAFLLESSNDWEPFEEKPTPDPEILKQVALEYLKKTFFSEVAANYLEQGIPEELGPTLKGSEVELLNIDGSAGDMNEKLLLYVGSKTISKHGCYGCHDIPGFEDAKPIGTALTDWGRKDPSKIAFEHIAEYLTHGGHGHGHNEQEPAGGIDESFYMHRLEHHDRTGFIWQKLKEPRSYDYMKALNKDYNERLRMPMFPLTDEQREQVITFVLGLVAEPPAAQFVYHPDGRQKAIIEGQKVLDKYNCGGCHVLETEKWEIEYHAGEFEAPSEDLSLYPFMKPHLAPATLNASSTPDKQRGTLTSLLQGMPTIAHPARTDDASPVLLYEEDEEWYPVEEGDEFDMATARRSITLWNPTAIDGHVVEAGQAFEVPNSAIKRRYLASGGDLTLKLLPRVLELERETNSQAKGSETWGWLPPPLHNEGTKVQPDWLHSFLLEPHMIRPAAFMRMPRFNLSSDEATSLVNYFAARDNAEYPYEYDQQTNSDRLVSLDQAYGGHRFDDAMQIVTYTQAASCVSCHIVADHDPGGSLRAKAPNLAEVYKRLRPDYVRRWVANPNRILPYTPMLSVIKYDASAEHLGGMPQELYRGTSVEQLDAVVDLLMNFDRYTAGRSAIAPLVKPAAGATAAVPSDNQQAQLQNTN